MLYPGPYPNLTTNPNLNPVLTPNLNVQCGGFYWPSEKTKKWGSLKMWSDDGLSQAIYEIDWATVPMGGEEGADLYVRICVHHQFIFINTGGSWISTENVTLLQHHMVIFFLLQYIWKCWKSHIATFKTMFYLSNSPERSRQSQNVLPFKNIVTASKMQISIQWVQECTNTHALSS